MSLPFLYDEAQSLVKADDATAHFLDLFEYSLYPDRKRLAFVGMFISDISETATLPMYDSQAR